MRSTMKFVIVIMIILVTFGLPVLLQQVINPRQVATTTPTPTVTELPDDIRFLSVPPALVPVKSKFLYKIVTASLSGNPVTVSVVAKPEWISWDASTNQLSGDVPSVGGVFTVTMRAKVEGGDVEDQTFTVTIENDADVKGAKTIGFWKDPFHPAMSQATEPVTPEENTVQAVLPGEPLVLGEKTVAKTILSDENKQYVLYGLGVVVVGVMISIIIKIVRVAVDNQSKLPKGVVIERGRQ